MYCSSGILGVLGNIKTIALGTVVVWGSNGFGIHQYARNGVIVAYVWRKDTRIEPHHHLDFAMVVTRYNILEKCHLYFIPSSGTFRRRWPGHSTPGAAYRKKCALPEDKSIMAIVSSSELSTASCRLWLNHSSSPFASYSSPRVMG